MNAHAYSGVETIVVSGEGSSPRFVPPAIGCGLVVATLGIVSSSDGELDAQPHKWGDSRERPHPLIH